MLLRGLISLILDKISSHPQYTIFLGMFLQRLMNTLKLLRGQTTFDYVHNHMIFSSHAICYIFGPKAGKTLFLLILSMHCLLNERCGICSF